jgi:hypothetical protein
MVLFHGQMDLIFALYFYIICKNFTALKYFLIIIILTLTLGCKSKKLLVEANKEKQAREYAEFEKEEEIEYKNQIDSARNDFKKHNYKYYHFSGMHTVEKFNEEMQILLDNYKIEFKTANSYCVLFSKAINAYEGEMNKLLFKKFGKSFFDSLEIAASKNYTMHHPNEFYDIAYCTEGPMFVIDTFADESKKTIAHEFFKDFKFPNNYTFKNEADFVRNWAFVSLNVDRDSVVSEIEVRPNFRDSSNIMYLDFTKEKIMAFIKKSKWAPGKRYGIPVNTIVNFTLDFKNPN